MDFPLSISDFKALQASSIRQLEIGKSKIRRLFGPAPEEQCAIGPTKAEGVRHRVIEFDLSRPVGNVVQVAFGIGVFQVYGGRQHLVAESQYGDAGLQASRSAEQVPSHGFGRTDWYFVGVLAKCTLNCNRFEFIA